MNAEDLKERVKDAVETENPTGTGYYGAELDEAEVEADRRHMEEATRTFPELGRRTQDPGDSFGGSLSEKRP